MIDHKQCKSCKYSYWRYGKGYVPKFIWCNCLDMTGEIHRVIDGVCMPNSSLTDENKKAEALRKAREMGKTAYISRKDD